MLRACGRPQVKRLLSTRRRGFIFPGKPSHFYLWKFFVLRLYLMNEWARN